MKHRTWEDAMDALVDEKERLRLALTDLVQDIQKGAPPEVLWRDVHDAERVLKQTNNATF